MYVITTLIEKKRKDNIMMMEVSHSSDKIFVGVY